MTPTRIGKLVACMECKHFRPQYEYEAVVQGTKVIYLSCEDCRREKNTKECVDCMNCGASLFFTEAQLETRGNVGGCRITSMPNGTHNLIIRDKFVIASCWPITRVAEMTEVAVNLMESLAITTES